MNMRLLATRFTQRGAAAIELGLLTLPLAAITFGTTEFGRTLHQYNTLTKSVRDGARYQTTQAPGAANTLKGRCLVLTGTAANNGTSCTGAALLPGLTLSQITICDRLTCPGTHNLQATGRGVVNLVTVTVAGYQFTSMAPFFMPSFTYGPISVTMPQPL